MTYLAHFSLKEKPFKLSPDPKFLWFGEAHKEAWAALHFGVADNRGFILLIGDVGTGKTTLVNKLIEGLDESTLVARISDPGLDQMDFFKFLAGLFGLKADFGTKGDFLVQFIHFLHRAHANQQTVVVIVDEAQRLSDTMLEEIRLLSNIERQDEKLINIVLVGQNELNEKLMAADNRALRQRITTIYSLGPLVAAEVEEYIRFRLKVAGTEEKLFTTKAVREIIAFSKGNPRLINVICDQALLTAFVQERRQVDDRIVKECARELTLPALRGNKRRPSSGSEENRSGLARVRGGLKTGLWAVGVLSILALIALVGAYFFRPQILQRVIVGKVPAPSSAPAVTPRPEMTRPPAVNFPRPAVRPPAEPSGSRPQASAKAPDAPPPALPAPVLRPALDGAPAPAAGPPPAARPAARSTVFAGPLPLPQEKTVLNFPTNSNELTSDMYEQLNRLVAVVKSRPGTRVTISGYTDDIGGENYNRYLSKFRADVVKSYFIGQGISSSQITALGRGSENPIAPNIDNSGRGRNRRVEVELSAPD